MSAADGLFDDEVRSTTELMVQHIPGKACCKETAVYNCR